MSKPFSNHEFFIQEGDDFRVEVRPHDYFVGDDALEENRPEDQRENAKIEISSDEATWSIEVSIPKAALKKLVLLAQQYLKDGEGHVFMTPERAN